jgi:hypothetical protein
MAKRLRESDGLFDAQTRLANLVSEETLGKLAVQRDGK